MSLDVPNEWPPLPDYEPEYTTGLAMKEGVDDFSDPIAIGETNYTKFIRKSKIFIDNTVMIKEFLTIQPPWSILYLGPRKYGKTLNLDMFKTFFEMIVDEDGDKITPQKITPTHKLFRKGLITMEDGTTQKLKRPFLIAKEEALVDKWQGRYPVIYLNFKNITGENVTVIKNKLWMEISKEYKRHKYTTRRLTEDWDRSVKGVRLNYENYLKVLELKHEDWYLPYSIKFLCEMLHLFYVRITFVFIDDYDAPFQYALRSNFSDSDVRLIADLLDRMARETFKGRYQFVRGIVVGRLPLRHYRWDDNWIMNAADTRLRTIQNYFGICQKDFKLLLDKLNITGDLAQQAHQWYKSHQCETLNQHFYSPSSVAHFLRTKQLASYWAPHENDHFIYEHLRKDPAKRDLLLRILSKQIINTGDAHYCCDKTKVININRIQDFSAFLAYEGYLRRNLTYAPNGFKAKLNNFTAELANYETAFQMSNWLISYSIKEYGVDGDLLQKSATAFAQSLTKDVDLVSLQQALQSLYKSATFPQDENQSPAYALHFTLECVLLQMQCETKFQIEVYYQNTMVADIVLFHNASRTGAIIELDINSKSADDALARAQMPKYVLWQFGTIKKMKFFGINIASDKTINVKMSQDLLGS